MFIERGLGLKKHWVKEISINKTKQNTPEPHEAH